MFERILCAVDGSEVSQKVIAAAQDLALKSGGEVVVFHAYHVPEEYLGLAKHYATGEHYLEEIRGKLAEEHRRVVEEAAETLRGAGVRVVTKLPERAPGPAIVAAAEDDRCDCIVLGSHGKGGVRRFLLGSVTDYVIHHAKTPVIVVR